MTGDRAQRLPGERKAAAFADGSCGILVVMERDQTWAAMVNLAEHMSTRYCEGDTVKVYAIRRRGLLTVTEGLQAADNWTDVFEIVRRRRVFSSAWTELRPVKEAAANIRAFLRERPDQATAFQPGCTYCRDRATRAHHLEQLAAPPESSDLLRRCDRCGTLWECPAFGRDDTMISSAEARDRYPGVDLSAL